MAPIAEQRSYTLSEDWAEMKQAAKRAKAMIDGVLDQESKFFSRIMEQSCTLRQGLRAGVMLPLCLMVTVACGVEAPLVTLASIACTGWLTYRVNKDDNGIDE